MDIQPARVYSGVLMTSLNSVGIHISLLKLTESHRDIFVDCLDEKTTAPCWPGCDYSISSTLTSTPFKDTEKEKVEKIGISLNVRDQHLIKSCLTNACTTIIEKEADLNELDRGCGDGDCGSTLKRFAEGTHITTCVYVYTDILTFNKLIPTLHVHRYLEQFG